jgi:hypothetical protein
MKNQFFENGESRIQVDPQKLKALRDRLEARYAPEIARAQGLGYLILRWRLGWEYYREVRKLHPSPYSLYVGC